jgi:hypothetical protein
MGGTPQLASSLLAGRVATVSGDPPCCLSTRENETASAPARKIRLSSIAPVITTRRYINRRAAALAQFMRAYVEGVCCFKNQQRRFDTRYRNSCVERQLEIALLYDDQRDGGSVPVTARRRILIETDPKAGS